MNIPKEILRHIKDADYIENKVGFSGSKILEFKEHVLKIENKSFVSDNEIASLKWLEDKLKVPRVIETITYDKKNFILMTKLDGVMSYDESLLKDPHKLIRLLAQGIKQINKVNMVNCPNPNLLDKQLDMAIDRIENKNYDIEEINFDLLKKMGLKTAEEGLDYLIKNKPVQDKAFVHGDYCLPNVFIKDNEISGFIDLGLAGISEIWHDVSLCIRSLEYNLGADFKPEFIDILLNELEIEMDEFKYNYYLLLDELF